jgi:hypothetical protein
MEEGDKDEMVILPRRRKWRGRCGHAALITIAPQSAAHHHCEG